MASDNNSDVKSKSYGIWDAWPMQIGAISMAASMVIVCACTYLQMKNHGAFAAAAAGQPAMPMEEYAQAPIGEMDMPNVIPEGYEGPGF